MIWYALAVSLIALGMGGMCYGLIKSNRSIRGELKNKDAAISSLKEEVVRRDHIISRMEEVYREADTRKDAVTTGTRRDRFDSSRRVLNDIAGHDPNT